ncbi:MAG: preprotein translocase subunit SecA [Patescibacteria group bacterium]
MWFFDSQSKIIKKLQDKVSKINDLESKFSALSDEELKKQTDVLKERLINGESLDDILSEAFAQVREAAKRAVGLRHYDVQLIGGMVLHQSKISEMKTGEGKTLVATLPAYLNALTGKGVHVVTVNDYLAQRDAIWMGKIYNALGLSVSCIVHDAAFLYDPSHSGQDKELDVVGNFKVFHEFLRPVTRREAYFADITYGTNNEFGFDYLRDNLVLNEEDMAQREHHFAIIDEVDSILIDEARTPLIISMPDEESGKLYQQFSRITPHLTENVHYNIDEKLRAVTLTEEGVVKVEQILGVDNIYDTTILGSSGIRYLHHLEQALKAQFLFKRDKDYIVKDNEVIIVDEFTGRLMPGRRYSEGLHQALEAKERVIVQKESRTLASITFQNYFRMYQKLAGMTGTASTSAEEFSKVYNLDVVQIPTNKPNIRKDLPDMIFMTERGKFKAVAEEIRERHKLGQPVLVGTVSIEKNEHLSALLKREGVPHQLLNAKNHEMEAEIIAQAGKFGGVTVATNMAGRGVDIILGGNPPSEEETGKVRELGGLFVIGTERHEARRIDNQLRGRGGRQGDPGATQFFVSLEDDLMRVFGGEKIKRIMDTLKLPEDQPIKNPIISKSIESAQTKIEGHYFDARKHVLEYDEVMNKQRQVIYKLRREIVKGDGLKEKILNSVDDYLAGVIALHTAADLPQEWNMQEIKEDLNAVLSITTEMETELSEVFGEEAGAAEKRQKLITLASEFAFNAYDIKEQEFGDEDMRNIGKMVVLRNIDTLWMDHLENMEHLRDSVRLRAYGQHDPLIEYKNEGRKMFDELLEALDRNIATTIFKVGARPASEVSVKPAQVNLSAGGENAKIGRNDPCPCNSGKKYKRCHGA